MIFVDILGYIMNWLYGIFGNYGIAIIMFTLASKIILLPISIIVQKNSIKMVKMQPDINRININFYGDKDTLGHAMGKEFRASLAILDEGLAKGIRKHMEMITIA